MNKRDVQIAIGGLMVLPFTFKSPTVTAAMTITFLGMAVIGGLMIVRGVSKYEC